MLFLFIKTKIYFGEYFLFSEEEVRKYFEETSKIHKEKIAVDVPLNTIQSGVYGCDLVTCPDWGLNTGSGGRDYNTWIAFPSPFSTTPMVIVNISMFDMWSGSNPRLSATASQITNEGFTLTFHTWADTLVYGASATWLAYGEN